eukprot:366162-Chlamydomonas_euryale.AAC.13
MERVAWFGRNAIAEAVTDEWRCRPPYPPPISRTTHESSDGAERDRPESFRQAHTPRMHGDATKAVVVLSVVRGRRRQRSAGCLIKLVCPSACSPQPRCTTPVLASPQRMHGGTSPQVCGLQVSVGSYQQRADAHAEDVAP